MTELFALGSDLLPSVTRMDSWGGGRDTRDTNYAYFFLMVGIEVVETSSILRKRIVLAVKLNPQ